MNIFDVIVLGVIQGITEFLPISLVRASGAGQISPERINAGCQPEVWLHLGTLVAVMVYFRRRIITIIQAFPGFSRRICGNRIGRFFGHHSGTLPAVIIGLSFKRYIERLFTLRICCRHANGDRLF